MLERTAIVSRSAHEGLTRLAHELIELPVPRLAITNEAADIYFYKLLAIDAEWVINVDEDAFIWDSAAVVELQDYMQTRGYVACGMPDGGVISHRFHNPVVPNAFFNILNVGALRRRFDTERLLAAAWQESFKASTPHEVMTGEKYEYDNFEPYYKFFFWILNEGFPILYLGARPFEDDAIATVLISPHGKEFLVHSWYAREYEKNPERIHSIYQYAQRRKADLKSGV